MPPESTFVFGLIAVAGILMASNRVRFDIVALLVVLALMISGVLTVGESLAGFGSPVVIMVAGLLVVGEMLARTGFAALVGDWILKRGGKSEIRLLILIMLGSSLLGAVMSSTAVVAIFIPIIIRIAADTGLNASRMLLPMSYAALISGMLTLIATAPNLVVNEELKSEGYEGFGFFGFTAVGIVILGTAIAYFLLVGRHMLTDDGPAESGGQKGRSILDLWRSFNERDDFVSARVEAGSRLLLQTVEEATLESRYGIRLVGIETGRRDSRSISVPDFSTRFAANDVLVLIGPSKQLTQAIEEQGLSQLPKSTDGQKRFFSKIGGAAVLIHPESELLGRTIREAEFHSRHQLQVLGMRHGTAIVPDYADTKLAQGDSLFVHGPWSRIKQLANNNHDFVVLEMPGELYEVVPAREKLPIALAILAGMVALTIFDILPLVAAVLIAVLAAISTRCLTMDDAYRAIPWSSIVLIAGMLPLADALDATGGTQVIVDKLLYFAGDASPYKMLTILFFLTAGLGLVLSNTASAVLVAPIAIYTANVLGVSPYPFALAVLIAASAAYSTPVSTPVVTLVVDPGRYKFSTFVKLGLPLLILTYIATMLVAPLVFPF